MAVVEPVHDAHHDDHHGHGEFIAHHFESAEQQYDSGKLGIWVFLVTEVLFFSGLFVAYTLWRSHHPEVFQQAHVFLDKVLGGINTVVLLFSSLTMAWGVRAAQLGQNKTVANMTLITMVCAAMFLGIKAVEYSHKWDIGLKPARDYTYSGLHAEATYPLAVAMGISDWLVILSIIPALLLAVFVGMAVFLRLTSKPVLSQLFVGLAITVGGYFLGAVGGQVYMKAMDGGGEHAAQAPVVLHASSLERQDGPAVEPESGQDPAAGGHENADSQTTAQQAADHGPGHDDAAHDDHAHAADAHAGDSHAAHSNDPHMPDPDKLSRDVRIFFSIYYCMTGLHAFHILGGIAFLSWIYYRSLENHWRPDYFGPVDYVGLYWHLVDLIWIYLFPMLYLID